MDDFFRDMKEMEARVGIPDVFEFLDGSKVENRRDWEKRAAEIKGLYEYYMYGPFPEASQENQTYILGEWKECQEKISMPDGEEILTYVKTADLRIEIQCKDKKSGFDTIICLPQGPSVEGGYPVYLEMSFVWPGKELELSPNDYYAASRGYASICYNPCSIASDDSTRTGAFYDLYPYGKHWKEQTGVLAAWGWAASKILDVLTQGLAEKLQINHVNNLLSGVSRYGKATLLAGAYDKRIRVVVPACSGAGGAAMYRYKSEGRTYDFASLGHVNEEGTTTHFTTQNEALGNLQSTNLRHWFNDHFLEFDTVEQFPMDQHHLAALIADRDRYLFLISGMLGEDWVNPAASGLTYAAAKQLYKFLGLEKHICLCEHLQGHAVLLRDMVKLLDYCDVMLYGQDENAVKTDFEQISKSVFWEEVNLDREAYECFLG